MKILPFLFSILLFTSFIQSDFTAINGTIKAKNKPIEGVKIKWHSISKKSYGVLSDSYGRYQLNVKAGDTQGKIEISFPKKDTIIITPNLIEGKKYTLNAELRKGNSTYDWNENQEE